MGILGKEGEWGAQCTSGEYVKMVDSEVDKIIFPSPQAEFGYMEAGGFEPRDKVDGGRLCVD